MTDKVCTEKSKKCYLNYMNFCLHIIAIKINIISFNHFSLFMACISFQTTMLSTVILIFEIKCKIQILPCTYKYVTRA